MDALEEALGFGNSLPSKFLGDGSPALTRTELRSEMSKVEVSLASLMHPEKEITVDEAVDLIKKTGIEAHPIVIVKIAYKMAAWHQHLKLLSTIEFLRTLETEAGKPASSAQLRKDMIEELTGVKQVSKAQKLRDAKANAMSLFG